MSNEFLIKEFMFINVSAHILINSDEN